MINETIEDMKKVVLDTSHLMNDCNSLENLVAMYQVIIPIVVVEELDHLKQNKDTHKAYKARKAIKKLEAYLDTVIFYQGCEIHSALSDSTEYSINDNIIITCAHNNNAYFVTEDLNLKIKAKALGVECVEVVHDSNTIYKGYKEVALSFEEETLFYENLNQNTYNCLVNEYLIITDEDNNFKDSFYWDGEKYCRVVGTKFKSRQLGDIKPLDTIQTLAFNSIKNNDVTVLFGRSGSGKSTLPLHYIMQEIESGRYDECKIIFSYDTLKNQKTLGYVKGTNTEKFLGTSSLGGILTSKFGDISEVEKLLASGRFEIIPTANIRGIEFSSKTLIWATEAQNLDLYALKTLIQRCKEGAKLILEGDIVEQSDTDRGVGIYKMIEVFKGYKSFGCVKLRNNYRSEIGELADLLD